MIKDIEERRIAKFLGWEEVTSLAKREFIGQPDAVHGETMWLPPGFSKSAEYPLNQWHMGDSPPFCPWECANDDYQILEAMRKMSKRGKMSKRAFSDYKDALYHETRGHATHTVWEYQKGKFANAWVIWANGDLDKEMTPEDPEGEGQIWGPKAPVMSNVPGFIKLSDSW